VTLREFLFSFKDAVLAIIMPVIIIGGIVGGLFTPTEAAVVSVAYALLLGFVVYRSLTLKDLLDTLHTTVINASKLFFILAGVNIIAWVFSFERLPDFVEQMFTAATQNTYVLLLLINVFFIFMGTWMDVGASILLFAPVVGPLAIKLGVNPIQFGIMIVINSCIGLCTPPVGVVLFAISDMAKEDILKISKDLLPFLLINFIIILMVAYIPWLTLYLPRLFGFIQ
jgi:tripartite ATP-independent transporter DctM subunit